MFPSWPGWDGLHPLVIHFPIGLLMVAPLFVLLAALWPRRSAEFSRSALVLLFLGTLATFVAVATGEAAGELADHTPAINAVLERHAELAETTRNVFAVLTIVYAAIVLVPLKVARLARPLAVRVANTAFLVLLVAATLLLTTTAHQGGRLVHELGVHALMPGPAATAER